MSKVQWADLPATTPAERAWKYGGIFTQEDLTDDTRLDVVGRQLANALETRGSDGLVFLGRSYDARTGIYAASIRPDVFTPGYHRSATTRPCIVVGHDARNAVAWIEDDGSITVTDCARRTTSTTCGIEWAIGNGRASFRNYCLTAFGKQADCHSHFQNINSKRGVLAS